MADELNNGGVGVEHSEAEDVEFLGEDTAPSPDTKTEDKTKPEVAPPQEPEVPEEEAPEEEPEEKEEEPKEGEVSTHPRPSIKQIEEKFPNFFKTFPDLRHAIAREQRYTELFPVMEDAVEAKENSENYEYLRDQVLGGQVGDFLDELKEVDSGAYKKFTNSFLPTLYEKDRDGYFALLDPIVGNMLSSVYSRAADENTKNAALVLSQYIFGDLSIAQGKRVLKGADTSAAPKSQEQEDFEKEKREFQQSRFATIQQEIESNITSELTDKIKSGIDPDGELDSELVDMLVEKVFREIDKSLGSDRTHQNQMSSLWKRGFRAGLSGDWKSRIISAYLARAEHLIPAARSKVKSIVMKTRVNNSDRTRTRSEEVQSRREIPATSRPAKTSGGNYSSRDIDYSRTSDLDIIEDRPTLKRR